MLSHCDAASCRIESFFEVAALGSCIPIHPNTNVYQCKVNTRHRDVLGHQHLPSQTFLVAHGPEIGPMKAVAEEMDFQLQILDDVPEAGGLAYPLEKLLYIAVYNFMDIWRRPINTYRGTSKWMVDHGKSNLNSESKWMIYGYSWVIH